MEAEGAVDAADVEAAILGEEEIRWSESSKDSVGMIGGGLDSGKDAHSTGDEGVDVGDPGVASEEEVTPLSFREFEACELAETEGTLQSAGGMPGLAKRTDDEPMRGVMLLLPINASADETVEASGLLAACARDAIGYVLLK